MALVKYGPFAQLSGSINGYVFSRNRAGAYVRNRSLVTNPNTPFQVEARGNFRDAVDAWTNTINQTSRDEWETYAANTPVLNRLGDPIHLSGQQMFIRSYQAIAMVGGSAPSGAPAIFDLGTFTLPTITADASAGELSVAFTNTDEWATAVGGFLSIKQSRPQNPTVNFFRGPWRFVGMIEGDVVAPTSPVVIDAIHLPLTAGQKLFFEVRAINADFRVTNVATVEAIVVA